MTDAQQDLTDMDISVSFDEPTPALNRLRAVLLNIALDPIVRMQLDQLARERGRSVTALTNEILNAAVRGEMQTSISTG